jgi:hypothetical protein
MASQIENMNNPRTLRLKALEHHYARLQRRLDQLSGLDRRFSWYRLVVFVLGVAAAWLALVYLEGVAVWLVILMALASFSAVVYYHRRLDSGIARFRIWQQIKAGKLARMKLDWEHITGDPQYGFAAQYGLQGEQSSLEIDLDLSGPRSLHHLLDLAISKEGSRTLAGWLSAAEPDPQQITERQAVVRELATMPGFIDHLLLNLRLVSREQLDGQRLLAWLTVSVPDRRLTWVLAVGSLLAVLNVILFILNVAGQLPAYWTFTVVLSLGFYFFNAHLIGEFLNAVVALDNDLDKFNALLGYLERYPYQGREHLAALTAPFTDPKRLPSKQIRRVKSVTAAIGLRSNPILGLMLNAVLPWDFAFAWLASRMQAGMAAVLPDWLRVWYRLEGLCSLANFAYINPEYSFPAIELRTAGEQLGGPVFKAQAMGHPLIPVERKVCNDFTIPELGGVMIITGSNMAGKSTFIKTVGINLCLTYAGGPVDAAYLRTLPFRLHTCIRISDSITDGFSYFYAEVRCLRALLDKLKTEEQMPVLYLIDEIFRGTNNRERLIGSQAYVSTLIGAYGVGLIATHDLELAHLEETSQKVDNFHFRDRVQDGRLVFDYKILPGPCPTSNALNIMAMEGLPVPRS